MSKKLLSLFLAAAMACSLCIPAGRVSAANTAKKALNEKAEALALAEAEKDGTMAVWAFADINKDGTTELIYRPNAAKEKNYSIKLYGYGNKTVSLVKTFKNVYDFKRYAKTIIIKSKKNSVTAFTTYTYSKKKVTQKTVYRYNSKKKTYTKNGKKIKKSVYTKYTNWFKKRKEFAYTNYSEAAYKLLMRDSYIEYFDYCLDDASLVGVMRNGNDIEQYKVSIMSYDESGQASITDSISCFRNTTPERTTIGKFDITKPALLDTEEFDDYIYDEVNNTGSTFTTYLRPSNAPLILPGFEFPENADVQGYELVGKYFMPITEEAGANAYHISRADFYLYPKGEKEPATPFATYFFDRIPYSGLELPIAYEIDGFEITEPVKWLENKETKGQLDLSWQAVPGAASYYIRYCFDQQEDETRNTYYVENVKENKLSIMPEKNKSVYVEIWAEVEQEGVSKRFCVLLGERRGYENLFD